MPADQPSDQPGAQPTCGTDFDTVWTTASGIGGWLTRDQARTLWDEARRLAPTGRIVEIGSHQGRSTVVLASARASARASATPVVAIDPFVGGAMFGGLATRDAFVANLAATGLTDRVELRQAKSTELRPGWREPIDFLYIDGKHDYWTVSDDLRWAAFLPDGGHVAIHDAFSSIGVTLGLLRHVLPGRQLRYLDRTGSLARFEVGAPSQADRLRLVAELPWWLRNVGIKILLRLKLYPVARLVGHHGTADPY